MPYPRTYPNLYDRIPQIDLWELRKQGLIEMWQKPKTTSITWRSDNGAKLVEVLIAITTTNRPHVALHYEYYDEKITQKIFLTTLRYGVGNGRHWYFLTSTGERFRKLYFVNGKFLDRRAFKGLYMMQTKSRKARHDIRLFDTATAGEKAYDSLQKKYFKTLYRGKPTKRYIRLIDQIRKSERFTIADIERMYLR